MPEAHRKKTISIPDQPKHSLLKPARRILFIIGGIVGIVELVQHFILNDFVINLYLIGEVVVYFLALPAVGWILLGYLERSEKEGAQSVETLQQQTALNRMLGSASEWDAVVRASVEFPHLVLSVEQAQMFLDPNNDGNLEAAGSWSKQSGYHSSPAPEIHPYPCKACSDFRVTTFHRTNPPETAGQMPEGRQIYCLPLDASGQQLGLIQLEVANNVTPTFAQIQALNNGAVVAEMAVERANLRSTALTQELTNQEDRKHVAQNLHDTLGQNIAYLRLRLDELLLEEDPSLLITTIQQELGHMREVADQAYLQMRQALVDLHEDQSIQDLAKEALNRAQLIGQRSGYKVFFEETGKSMPLDAHTNRQLVYVLREGLHNIEKHSHAGEVHLAFHWQSSQLEVILRDNGVGFDDINVDHSQHFGLEIMQERIASAHGRLEISSKPGSGTTITIQLPVRKPVPAREL
jgi:signal transduction histidine kinase